MHGDLCESCRNDWRNSDCASTKPKPNCCRWQAPSSRHSRVRRLPTFDFLSFTHYWEEVGRKSSIEAKTTKKRFRRALASISGCARNATLVSYLRSGKHRAKLRGHFNYFGVTDNSRALYRFERAVHALLLKWLNRRSQRRSFTWEGFRRYQARHPLPKPGRLVSLYPV